ncbi:hypothetical protein [Phytomonospora endophytica]|uniref:Uncharacterized protein n=1 Tax=Phytomonospora endophytica TaxID=714109 RepID=A0A841FPA4_9ACTN|nr:hypothetical protein [Phytomonospora endophytica]MBB6037935.1 hypothetical protein [Phytomonospora endophytica]GIG68835.1 hypothetical protein Pen01_51300 [Phytomonospora endophytica]
MTSALDDRDTAVLRTAAYSAVLLLVATGAAAGTRKDLLSPTPPPLHGPPSGDSVATAP